MTTPGDGPCTCTRCVELFKRNPFASLTALILVLLVLLVYLPWPFAARVVDAQGRVIELVDGTRDVDVTALAVGSSTVWVGSRYSGLLPVVGTAVAADDMGVSDVTGVVQSLVLTDLHLWGAAADEGLFILAGRELQRPRIPFGLQGLSVTALAMGDDRMWVGTTQGLLSYNLSTWSTYLMKGREQPLAVTALLNQGGKLWVGTTEGLYTFDRDWNAVGVGQAATPQIFSLGAAADGGVYCGGQHGLAHIAGDGRVTLIDGVPTPVRAIARLDTTVWVGGENGAYQGTGLGPFDRLRDLPYDRTTALAVDERILWVGTDRGCFAYHLVPSQPANPAALDGLPPPPADGRPVDPWSSAGRPLAAYVLPEEFATRQTFFVKADARRRRVWLGTEVGAFLFDEAGQQVGRFGAANGLPDDKVHVIDVAEDGTTWFGTMGGLARLQGDSWTVYRKADGGLLDDNVWAALSTEAGIWVGTDGGLQLLDREGRWNSFTIKNSPLPENWIQSMARDAKGTLYVGIWNGGVGRYRNGAWDVFTDPDGQPDVDERPDDGILTDAVTAVLVDGRDHLWVGTTRGLCRFDGNRWYDYTHPDWGVVTAPINYLEMAPDDETLVVTGADGFTFLKGESWRTYRPLRGAGSSVLVRSGTVRSPHRTESFVAAAMPSGYVWSAGFLGNRLVLGLARGTAALVF